MAKNLEAYKLSVRLDADGARALATLKDVDKQAEKTSSTFQKLKTNLKAAFKGDAEAGRAIGESVGSQFVAGFSGSIENLGQTIGTVIGTAVAPGVGTIVGSLAGQAVDKAGAVLSRKLSELAKAGLDLNIYLEKAQVHFEAITGSAGKAAKFLDDLDKIEGEIGIDIKDLISASQRLEEFNFTLNQTQLTLRAAGDAAASFGSGTEGFNAIVNTLGLMTEKGELTTKMLVKLERQGVPALKYLAEATGQSERKLKDLINKGQVRGDVAARLIAEGIEVHKGGTAQRIMENTLYGQMFRYNDNLEDTAAKGTKNLARGLKDYYQVANHLLESDAAQNLAGDIDNFTGRIVTALERGVQAGRSGGIAAGFKETGKYVVQGLVDGLTESATLKSLTDAGNRLAETAWSATKSWLGIQSPSTKYIELGEYSAEGYVRGFEQWMAREGNERLSAALARTLQQQYQRTAAGGDLKSFAAIAQRLGIPLPVLLGVASRETGIRNIIGDHGRGVGVMQVDTGTDAAFKASGAWKDVGKSIERGAQILIEKMRQLQQLEGKSVTLKDRKGRKYTFTVPHLEGEQLLQTAIASYNSGMWAAYHVSKGRSPDYGTTGRNYSADVLARARVFAGITGLPATAATPAGPKIAAPAAAPVLSFAEAWALYHPGEPLPGTAAAPVSASPFSPTSSQAAVPVKVVDGGAVDGGAITAAADKLAVAAAADFGELAKKYFPLPVPPSPFIPVGTGQYSQAQKDAARDLRTRPSGGLFSGMGADIQGPVDENTGEPLPKGKATVGQGSVAGMKQAFREVGKIGRETFNQWAQGVGSVLHDFVLLGETGPAALKKVTAQVLASAAQECAVLSIVELAKGFATMFTNPAESASHFTAAAIFASVAGAAAITGRAIAGDSFKNKDQQEQQQLSREAQIHNATSEGSGMNRFTRRATGGPVYKGRAYLVGDGGRTEVFEPDENGYVHSSIESYRRSRDSRTGEDLHAPGAPLRVHSLSELLNLMMHRLEQGLRPLRRLEVVNANEHFVRLARRNATAVGDALVDGISRNDRLSSRLGQRIAA
ncbi:MAG TPA: tape measure protein [Blastocatellia bacterium]|nr:tape measure protein [Blastocatellia bacterium]